MNCSQIWGDIFANFAVASRCTQAEPAIFELKDDRQAIKLWLDNVAEAGMFVLGK